MKVKRAIYSVRNDGTRMYLPMVDLDTIRRTDVRQGKIYDGLSSIKTDLGIYYRYDVETMLLAKEGMTYLLDYSTRQIRNKYDNHTVMLNYYQSANKVVRNMSKVLADELRAVSSIVVFDENNKVKCHLLKLFESNNWVELLEYQEGEEIK